MGFSEKNENEYQEVIREVKGKKIRKFFVVTTLGIFILLLILKIPLIVALIVGVSIGLLGWGYQIETWEGTDSIKAMKRRRIKKFSLIGIPTIILIGLVALGIEHYFKTSRTDALKISREFTIWFIQGNKSNTLKYCLDEQKKRIGEDFDKIRSLKQLTLEEFRGVKIKDPLLYLTREHLDYVRSLTSLVALSRFGVVFICTYKSGIWYEPVYLTVVLLNGKNYSLWQNFLYEVTFIEYLSYLFPSPGMADYWSVFSFKVDDEFEKVLKKELESSLKSARLETLKSKKLERRGLNEDEKKEYEKYEQESKQESKEVIDNVKSRLTILADKDYRDQWEQKRVEFFGNWIKNEIQRQLDQVKTWEENFGKMLE